MQCELFPEFSRQQLLHSLPAGGTRFNISEAIESGNHAPSGGPPWDLILEKYEE